MAEISLTGAITVPGYVKKTVYNGNIEYRNFNPDLVGLQLTSAGGTPLLTVGNFNITTNLDPKINKSFISKQFSEFITLEDLKLTVEQTEELLNNNTKVFLNIDKSKLSYYAKFASLTDFIRVGLENIIINWPASIFLRPVKNTLDGQQIIGNTYENYSYNKLTETSTFRVPTNLINNPYNINYLTNGNINGTFNETNPLRNMVINFSSYALLNDSKEYDVVGFTGSTSTVNDYLYFEVKGEPFSSITSTISFHIKPKEIVCDNFFNSLDEFEYYLLNRLTYPKYTATFRYPLRTDFGVLLYTETSVTWPTTDGYNLDYETSAYDNYATNLLTLASDNDLINSNIMTRFLVSESITGFDTLPYYLSDEDQDTSGGKVNKLLNIYGVSYDDVNRYIEGLAFANTVSYDKLDNTPDVYLKNIARVMGWELIESVISNDLLTDYIKSSQSTYSGQSVGLTPVEADIELWRRIILNTPWIWKSKGSRKSVEFLLRFIGAPRGLITFNEYIYKADKPIDIDLFITLLQLNDLDTDLSIYPIDDEGYPRFLNDTEDLYFQGNGLWYRETSGLNSTFDITSGNNPHIGPYDRGAKYFNQLKELIPNFVPVIVSSSTITTTTQDLFTNYNTGQITDYDGELYVDIEYENGQELPSCITTTTEIITDPKPEIIDTECGCPINQNDESLSICIEKQEPIEDDDCYVVYILDTKTFSYIFTQYFTDEFGNNTTTTYTTPFIDRECCTAAPVNGLVMYNEIYNAQTSTISSGFVCCQVNQKCACNISANWHISDQTYSLNNDKYIIFLTLNGLGSEVVVGADQTICPSSLWATPTQIVDPYSNVTGIGCKLTQYALNNYSILQQAFIEREITNAGCNYRWPTQPVDPPTVTCLPSVLTNVVFNEINSSFTFTWTLQNTVCTDNYSVALQYSFDGTTWSDFTLSNPASSPSDLTATTIGGYNMFNSLVYFRLRLQYQISYDCNPPYIDCNTVSQNQFTLDFTTTEEPEEPSYPYTHQIFISTQSKVYNNTILPPVNQNPHPFQGICDSYGDSVDVFYYLLAQNQSSISLGDRILVPGITNCSVTPCGFNGQNKWWALEFAISPNVNIGKICKIDISGYIQQIANYACSDIITLP